MSEVTRILSAAEQGDPALVGWLDFGQGLQPCLNEGTMMTNIHQRP
jgi:hypothetical protein